MLYRQISSNKKFNIHINNGQWYVESQGQLKAVSLQDYWLQTQFLCIWLRGPKKSIVFVVRRSIIGAEKFSQLRAIIT